MKKIRDILRLKYDLKLTHRAIGRALNISPGTVSYYTQAAKLVNLSWPLPNEMSDSELTAKLEPVAKQLRVTPPRKILPDWAIVNKALSEKHMTLQLQWELYRQQHGEYSYSYAQYTRLYKRWLKKMKKSMRLEHKAGEKGFIDYAGTTLPVYDRETGEIAFKAQVFVMALGLSHYTFAYASRSQTLPDWIDCHRRAFNFFGGVPAILVPDNLKSGITDSCQFEPEANPTYAEMAEHYGTVIIPARPRTPQDKSIAENAVLVSSRWIIARLAKQRFYTLEALNNAIADLLLALNNKPFQKRSGSRTSQFNELEKPHLRALPDASFELAHYQYQTVANDYHVRIDKHYYSVPHQLVAEKVLCRCTQTTIEVLFDGKRYASHLRSFEPDKKTTVDEHMPASHLAFKESSPEVFLAWANKIGPAMACVAQDMIENKKHPELCNKAYFGFKKLAKQYGHARLDKACRRALALDCIQFKSIRSILEKRLDLMPYLESLPSTAAPLHDNVRGAKYYKTEKK